MIHKKKKKKKVELKVDLIFFKKKVTIYSWGDHGYNF